MEKGWRGDAQRSKAEPSPGVAGFCESTQAESATHFLLVLRQRGVTWCFGEGVATEI